MSESQEGEEDSFRMDSLVSELRADPDKRQTLLAKLGAGESGGTSTPSGDGRLYQPRGVTC